MSHLPSILFLSTMMAVLALALPRPQQKGAPAEIIPSREEQKKGAVPAKGTDPYPVHPAHSGWPSAAVIAAQEAPIPLPAPIEFKA